MQTPNDFQYANTVRGLIERIAFEIGDAVDGDAYAVYDQEWIKARIYDTFKWLQGRRPELFAETVELTLCEGSRQTLPEECDRLIEVLSVTVAGKAYSVNPTDFRAIRAAQAYEKLQTCSTNNCLFHAAADDNNVKDFWFTPAAPPTGAWEVTATCSSMERFFNDLDKQVDCEVHKWFNTVIEYVKHLAFSTERDTGQAEQARATFFDLAPVQRRDPQ